MIEAKAMVGRRAPAFLLPSTQGPGTARRRVSLDDFQDRWLMLLFYPRDFSLVCPTELTAISNRIDELIQRDCAVLGVSTDSIEVHEQWIGNTPAQGGLGGLNFPLASDEDGAVGQAYGVYVPKQHLALRGLFMIDPNGILQYQAVHNLSVGRSSEEILRVLDALQQGGLCPAEWKSGQPALDPAQTLGPNRVVGQYRIEAMLGSGGFASVYRAKDLTLQRMVALKVIRQELAKSAEAALNEARAAAALNHPNICIVYAVDSSQGFPMIVMEFVEGQPLSKLLERGRLPLDRVKRLGREVALGMAAAHAQGIVHGDLKPANLMVSETDQLKIMDFGLARRYQPVVGAETVDNVVPEGLSGTPTYMAPEQARGEALTPATDVFSLGLLLYEMVLGKPAVDGTHLLQVLHRIQEIDAQALAGRTPEPLDRLLRVALQRDATARTLTMTQIAETLAEP
jgi:alkyl hydroperoxide reductase subunit AhpC/predicted Ser/Thr protein kinase